MEVLSMKNIIKSFDGLTVLNDISFSVEKGEVVAIIGPSGSGKSTLLRCATLLEKMDSGELTYMGDKAAFVNSSGNMEYASLKELKKIRERFGLVFQNFNLFPHYSVFKNITDAPLNVQKRDKAEVKSEAMALLDKMGLSDKANAYPYQLSGGQQQRVSIARALALKPEVLFFDEPTSALDPELTGDILRVIRKLASEHMTMVIVTHEIDFAKNVADRIIFMADGVIVEEGPAEEVINNPQNDRTKTFLSRLKEN